MFGESTSSELSYGSDVWASSAWLPLDEPTEDTGEGALSQQALEGLATADPGRLLRLISEEGLTITQQTFAAEALGDVPPSHRPQAIRLLCLLLAHEHPVVREGAVYGLDKIRAVIPALQEFLRPLASECEPSPGVRAAAQDALGLPGDR